MRIFYDGQIYLLQKTGGINRYFSNLIRRLPQDVVPVLSTYHVRPIHYPMHPNLQTFLFPGFRPQRVSCWIGKYYFRMVLPWHSFHLFHPTFHSFLAIDDISQCQIPIVFTVHDMIHELFPAMDPTGQESEKKRKIIMAAQSVICDSDNTKQDLLNRYAVSEENVTVIPLASDLDEHLIDGDEPVPLPPPLYYLYVGSRASYKNFDGLLSAFANAVSMQPELNLGVVGAAFTNTERTLITRLKLNNHILSYLNIPDSQLAQLYRHSVGLVYPSFYEGFGIPLLEAMSCGTVAIASNCSSIPEVVGEAGILFAPNKLDELTDILLDLPNNPTERERLIAKGYGRTKLFSWEKTAAQTIAVYRSTVAGK